MKPDLTMILPLLSAVVPPLSGPLERPSKRKKRMLSDTDLDGRNAICSKMMTKLPCLKDLISKEQLSLSRITELQSRLNQEKIFLDEVHVQMNRRKQSKSTLEQEMLQTLTFYKQTHLCISICKFYNQDGSLLVKEIAKGQITHISPLHIQIYLDPMNDGLIRQKAKKCKDNEKLYRFEIVEFETDTNVFLFKNYYKMFLHPNPRLPFLFPLLSEYVPPELSVLIIDFLSF